MLAVSPDLDRLLVPCCGVLAVARCIETGLIQPRTVTPEELDHLYHRPTLAIYCPLCGRNALTP